MTRDQQSEMQITTAAEFESVLETAIEKATVAGVDVRGAWEFETGGSTHEWEVQIFEIARDREGEGK